MRASSRLPVTRPCPNAFGHRRTLRLRGAGLDPSVHPRTHGVREHRPRSRPLTRRGGSLTPGSPASILPSLMPLDRSHLTAERLYMHTPRTDGALASLRALVMQFRAQPETNDVCVLMDRAYAGAIYAVKVLILGDKSADRYTGGIRPCRSCDALVCCTGIRGISACRSLNLLTIGDRISLS